jgi:hypothetical protein
MDAPFSGGLSCAGPLLANRTSMLRAKPPPWICILLRGLARKITHIHCWGFARSNLLSNNGPTLDMDISSGHTWPEHVQF